MNCRKKTLLPVFTKNCLICSNCPFITIECFYFLQFLHMIHQSLVQILVILVNEIFSKGVFFAIWFTIEDDHFAMLITHLC